MILLNFTETKFALIGILCQPKLFQKRVLFHKILAFPWLTFRAGEVCSVEGGNGAVVHVLDTGVVPSSPQAPKPSVGQRTARPIIQGSLVSWGPWQFRTALRDREGLVLDRPARLLQ